MSLLPWAYGWNDIKNLRSIPGCKHEFPLFNTQVGPEGKFTLESLTPGKWTVRIYSYQGNSSARGEDQIEIAEGETLERTFTINSGLLRGKVVDREGTPVAEARLSIRDPESEGSTVRYAANSQRDGNWKYDGVKPGVYSVTATKKGYSASKPVRLEVPADGESEEEVSVLGGLEDTGTLVSVTYQISDGKPLQKAWTKLTGEDGVTFEHGAQRDAEGVMTIEGVPPGTYDVEVSAWGFSVTNHPGTVIRTGETVRLEDVLHDCGSFDWTLTDKAGTPLPDVPVRFVPDDPTSIEVVREGRTNTQGKYSTRGISPGQYTATATPPGKSPLILPVTIVAHEGVEKTGVVE